MAASRQQAAGRRVRIGEDDAAVGLHVISRVDAEIVGQRHGDVIDAVQPAVDRVEAVGDVREENRRLVLQQRHEDVGQHFVRAVADENLLWRHAVQPGDGGLEQIGVGIGVEAQACGVGAEFRLNRRQHLGRGRVGVLVGVELDQVGDLGLLARHVGGEGADDPAPEATHGIFTESLNEGEMVSWPSIPTPFAASSHA